MPSPCCSNGCSCEAGSCRCDSSCACTKCSCCGNAK